MSTLMDFDDTNIDDGQDYPEYIETVVDDKPSKITAAEEEVEEEFDQHVDHIVEGKPKAKTKSKVIEEDQFELLSLKHQADLEAMQERLLESQSQVQQLNQQFQNYQAQQGNGNAASLLAAKEHELAQVKNEYIAARNAFNPEAEMAALDKRDRVMQEIAQLKSAPQQNNAPQQQQVVQNNPSQNKALDKLNQFVTKPEHAWMKNSFDTRTLTPLDADGMVANRIFQELTEQGKHPGTPSFWDLYGLELKKKIPAKYGSHYGKRSPSVSGNSGNGGSAPVSKPEVKLDGFQKQFTEVLSKGDPKKKERIARQLTGNVPSGNGNTMFEFGIQK